MSSVSLSGFGHKDCNSENAFDDELFKGTTIIAFFVNNEINLFWDSRESNEWMPKDMRKNNWIPKTGDTAEKLVRFSKNLVGIMAGLKKTNLKLSQQVKTMVEENEKKGVETIVSDIAEMVYNHLSGIKGPESVGLLLAGFDSKQGLQIQCVLKKEMEVFNDQISNFVSIGSGAFYSIHHLMHGYACDLSHKSAKELGYKCLFHSSFFDQNTGGKMKYCVVGGNKGSQDRTYNPLDVYREFYDEYDPSCILFMIINAKNQLAVSTDELMSYFRNHGEILVAHRVDHRKMQGGSEFFFHRLYFINKEEAEKAFSIMQPHNLPQSEVGQFPMLKEFPYGVHLNGDQTKALFVNKASKKLLKTIIDQSRSVAT